MASPQTGNGFIRIANELWDEVIRRDFTKRQKDVVLFIWRLSYGCRHTLAFIPMLKDFEICGVPATQITGELKYLISCKVLFWNVEQKAFSINKDYEQWQVSPGKKWDKDRFDELLSLNIKRKETSQNMKSDFMKDEVLEEDEGEFEEQDFTKHEVGTSQNMKSNFTKHEVEEAIIPDGSKGEEGSKDSKDIFKDIKDLNISSLDTSINQDTGGQKPPPDFSFENLFKIFSTYFVTDQSKLEFSSEIFGDLFDTYGGEAVYLAFKEAAKHEKYILPYVESILRGKPKPEPQRNGSAQINPSNTGVAIPSAEATRTHLNEIEELKRKKQEHLKQLAIAGT